jgi:3',5'-cyclic AMP phosphodiesterase CpdA
MRHFGPTYYSLDVGAMHDVVLQDVLYHGTGFIGYVDEPQLQWLEADLALIEPGRLVVVFLHIPLESQPWTRDRAPRASTTKAVNNRAAVYARLERFKAHVVSGHTHDEQPRATFTVPSARTLRQQK